MTSGPPAQLAETAQGAEAGPEPAEVPIALIGMMGAGKTTVGQALAARLGRPFLDLDALIESGAGRRVSEIFEAEGESGFRAREAAALQAALEARGAVIACGGGVVLDAANGASLRAGALVVWLQVDPRQAAERLGAGSGRPVLEAMPGDLPERLGALGARRDPLYRAAAHLSVDARGEVAGVVEQIVDALPAGASRPPTQPAGVRR